VDTAHAVWTKNVQSRVAVINLALLKGWEIHRDVAAAGERHW